MTGRLPRNQLAFDQSIQPYVEQLLDLLLNAGSIAAHHFVTPEELTRFRLSMQHPGPDTAEAERTLACVFAHLTEHALRLATVAVLDVVFQVDPMDGKQP